MTPDALAATHASAFTDERPWTAAEFAALLAQPGIILTGAPAAFVLGRITLDEAEILTIATDPARRRQGLARAALTAFHAAAIAQGARTSFLEVAETNGPARALYDSAGYRAIGRRPGYYAVATGPRIAALVLQKGLVAI